MFITRSKLKIAYTYSHTINNQAVYGYFVNNSQEVLWFIMHFDEIIYYNQLL